MPALESELAAVMDVMPYGLYIVGSQAPDGELNGMMADWLTQVSFQPRLLAVSFENTAHTLANIRQTRAFSINLLGQDHAGMELAQRFAQPYLDAKIAGRGGAGRASVHHKLDGLAYSRTSRGCPVLAAAIAWVDCAAEQFVAVGDHTLVVGQAMDGRVLRVDAPLTSAYTGWSYSG
jgi:flavin reductase (DIM6/NTAB) family NADH-FMN oxidoreductase RutF